MALNKLTRREAMSVIAAGAIPATMLAARPAGKFVENTMHMFAADQNRWPLHPNATYKPTPNSLESYVSFVREVMLDHTVLVQPEPYQDDHRYLEYCFQNEPSPGYFKGTCLFDPIDPQTPKRIEELSRRLPNRIVGMRIHEVHARGTPSTTSGASKDRDLGHPAMKNTWQKLHELGMLVQIQMIPCYAPQLAKVAAEFRDTPVLLDHLALYSRGTPEEYEGVLQLSKLPQVYMKISQLGQGAKPLIRRIYDAYGPDRLIWGSYGSTAAAFKRAVAQANEVFDYASEAERAKIRGENAIKLFQFKG
jgi:predicted TIM-barrel fold metal-dependent hydrolase